MSQPFLKTLEPAIIDLARVAGERILDIYQTAFDVAHKSDQSPLTQADLAAHRIITQGLLELTPEWPVLSEEGVELAFSERRTWEYYWLVDPLDGTREFIKRNDEFTVNIALIERQQPVLGVVYAPALGIMYSAYRGGHAYKHTADISPQRMHTRSVTSPGPVIVLASRSHTNPELEYFIQRLDQHLTPAFHPHRLLTMGSSLKACWISQGQADVYPRFGLTSEWDTAAAQCIVEVAGGALTDMQGQPLRYNTKASLLNPAFLVFGDKTHDWLAYI